MDNPKDTRIIAMKVALLEVCHGQGPLQSIASRHPSVTKSALHRVWHSFDENPSASQPLSINDIHISIDAFIRRPPRLPKDVQKLIFDTAIQFSKAGRLLIRIDVLDHAQMIVRRLPPNERAQGKFRDEYPTRRWLQCLKFTTQHTVKLN